MMWINGWKLGSDNMEVEHKSYQVQTECAYLLPCVIIE
jgi:hypothetical protein